MRETKFDYAALKMDLDVLEKGRNIHERMRNHQLVGMTVMANTCSNRHRGLVVHYKNAIWIITRFHMSFIIEGNLIEFDERLQGVDEIEVQVDNGGSGPFYSVRVLFEGCGYEIYINSALKDYLSQICFEMVADVDGKERVITVYLSSAFLATAKAVYLIHEKGMDKDEEAMRFCEIVGEAMRRVTE